MLTAFTGALVSGLAHVLRVPTIWPVAPLAADDRSAAGWLDGPGASVDVGRVLVAVLAVVLRDLLPPIDLLSAWSERIVGVALIGIGIWALRRSLRIDTRRTRTARVSHEHLHVQGRPAWARRLGHAHASFYMGILHGVAGSSHFFGVLPALALPTKTAAFVYIGAFGVGTVVAMTAFAAAVGPQACACITAPSVIAA